MKLAISNIGWTALNDIEMYQYIRSEGYSGIEIAPTRVFPVNPYENLQAAQKWADDLCLHYGLNIPSMQSIWYGRMEKIFGSEQERKALTDYTRQAIDFAAAIGCRNIVFGCPKNRVLDDRSAWQIGVDFFRDLAVYAAKHDVAIGMEANPDIYGTNYINTTNEALDLLAEVDMPAFKLNLDLGTMIQNEEKPAILRGQVQHISHVHISEPYLRPIEKRTLHRKIADILREENYQGAVSIEMGKVEDLTVLKKVMTYVKEAFGKDE